jgi:hypothetical protein
VEVQAINQLIDQITVAGAPKISHQVVKIRICHDALDLLEDMTGLGFRDARAADSNFQKLNQCIRVYDLKTYSLGNCFRRRCS